MDRIRMVIATVVAAVLLAACVTGSSLTHTPLYTVRMEQASNEMHFLSTALNEFAYITEKGCILIYDEGYSGVQPLEEPTVPGTCPNTCYDTCQNTCPYTCENTCEGATCEDTCQSTCEGPTCGGTCYGPTCKSTCVTCSPPPTCYPIC